MAGLLVSGEIHGALADWLAGSGFAFLLIFARVGAVVTALPGLSAVFVSIRIRLIIALAISLLLLPLLAAQLPALPASAIALAIIMLPEIIIGLFIGMIPERVSISAHNCNEICTGRPKKNTGNCGINRPKRPRPKL